jgi:hypothetical protein
MGRAARIRRRIQMPAGESGGGIGAKEDKQWIINGI